MSSIFSTQNLQTFLRRKNLRPPGPPPSRGPPGPRPGPPNLGRSPPGLPPSLRGGLSLAAACSGALVSSAITLLFLVAQSSDVQFFFIPTNPLLFRANTVVIPSEGRNPLSPATTANLADAATRSLESPSPEPALLPQPPAV